MNQIHFNQFYAFDDGVRFKPLHFDGEKKILILLYDFAAGAWMKISMSEDEFLNRNPHVI